MKKVCASYDSGVTLFTCAARGRGSLPGALHVTRMRGARVVWIVPCLIQVSRLRGGRQGWAATPAPPARDYVPWNPDLMHSVPSAWRSCLRVDWIWQQLSRSWHTKGMRRCADHAASLYCRGSGGRLAHPAGSATGTLWV